MQVLDIWRSLESTSIATAIRESVFLYPSIESVHVVALVLVFGMIARMDIRLMGLGENARPVSQLAAEVLPWAWGAFAIAAISGTFLFVSSAVTFYANVAFRLKALLLLLAGLNMLAFHVFAYKHVRQTGAQTDTPPLAKVAGLVSLLLWIGIVTCGRWIGFVGRA